MTGAVNTFALGIYRDVHSPSLSLVTSNIITIRCHVQHIVFTNSVLKPGSAHGHVNVECVPLSDHDVGGSLALLKLSLCYTHSQRLRRHRL